MRLASQLAWPRALFFLDVTQRRALLRVVKKKDAPFAASKGFLTVFVELRPGKSAQKKKQENVS